MSIQKPGPGEAIIIRPDGSFGVIPRAELERLKRGDTGIPDEPIATMKVSVENLPEAVERVLRLLSVGSGD